MTTQKKVLYKALTTMKPFFDAYELHSFVESKNIGIATVYRFLKSLEDQGEIHSYLCENRKIYAVGKKHHAHFTCERCSIKEHVTIKDVDFIRNVVSGEVCHFQVDIVGICRRCLSK